MVGGDAPVPFRSINRSDLADRLGAFIVNHRCRGRRQLEGMVPCPGWFTLNTYWLEAMKKWLNPQGNITHPASFLIHSEAVVDPPRSGMASTRGRVDSPRRIIWLAPMRTGGGEGRIVLAIRLRGSQCTGSAIVAQHIHITELGGQGLGAAICIRVQAPWIQVFTGVNQKGGG